MGSSDSFLLHSLLRQNSLIALLYHYYYNKYYYCYKLVLVQFDQPATLKTCTRAGVNGAAAVPQFQPHPARRGRLDTSGQATLARRISSRRRRAPADTAAFSIAARRCTNR